MTQSYYYWIGTPNTGDGLDSIDDAIAARAIRESLDD